jgi:ubiquinone/menaquinone biosynthesis C-methylase UbiE
MSHSAYDKLLEIVHASAAFELLRAGLVLGLFEALEEPDGSKRDLPQRLNIAPGRWNILIEGLKGIGLVESGDQGRPGNCPSLSDIIRRGELPVLAALVEFQAEIVSVGQHGYAASLAGDRNEGLAYFPGEGETLYERLDSNPRLKSVFFNYMQLYTDYASKALFAAHDFSPYREVLDVGGGGGALAAKLARTASGSRITLLDIDFARDAFDQQVRGEENAAAISFHRADMHADAFPSGFDLVVFAHQLVIWSPEQNLALLRKAHAALKPGGIVLICSSILDDDRTGPLMALLDAVYFQAVASGVGQIYSFEDYRKWLLEAGFSEISSKRLDTWTPHGVVTARKA